MLGDVLRKWRGQLLPDLPLAIPSLPSLGWEIIRQHPAEVDAYIDILSGSASNITPSHART